MHEKRGKRAGKLGSEGPEAAGGAFRAYGEPAALSEKIRKQLPRQLLPLVMELCNGDTVQRLDSTFISWGKTMPMRESTALRKEIMEMITAEAAFNTPPTMPKIMPMVGKAVL